MVVVVALTALWACGGGGGTGTPPPGGGKKPEPKQELRFVAQPSNGLAGRRFAAPIEVELKEVVTDEEVVVRIALRGASADLLTGTLERPVVGGIATFDDLRIERSRRNLSLVATVVGDEKITATSATFAREVRAGRRHIILMVADGWGYPHIEATRSLTGKDAPYAGMDSLAMATWDVNTRAFNRGKGYDPQRAWKDFDYLRRIATDSASSATAMFCGVKTNTGRIGVGPNASGSRLQSISDLTRVNAVAVGAISSVPMSHATPAAFLAHNDSRGLTRPIADEILFGDPAATGGPNGAHGKSPILPDVVISGGHPSTSGEFYVSFTQIQEARQSWTVVDRWDPRLTSDDDPPARLLEGSKTAKRLFGLFGGNTSNIPFRLHDGSGADPREPTLAQMSRAALQVLERKPKGFCLMIEGGAVDWAGHANDMSQMLGEMIDFDAAVAEVMKWIEDPSNGSTWQNTLLVVTGDHETGLLTAGPGVFPDQPLGRVTDPRIRDEKFDTTHGVRASWDDANQNGAIDPTETVHWTWNTGGHSNTLVPVYFRGLASENFRTRVEGKDPVRGDYVDNTSIYQVAIEALQR